MPDRAAVERVAGEVLAAYGVVGQDYERSRPGREHRLCE